jgi:hypothetical protein
MSRAKPNMDSVTRSLLAIVCFACAALAGPAHAADPRDKVFTIAKYPVEARAANAVEAKDKAITEGQQAALRSLLRRIVPVTAYDRLRKLGRLETGPLFDGMAVRSERNSRVEYIASLDFSFSPDGVRRLLDGRGIPYVDEPAKPVGLVLAYVAPRGPDLPADLAQDAGQSAWLAAWTGLDLENTVTPLVAEAASRHVHADTLAAAIAGEAGAMRTIAAEHRREPLLVAIASPDLAKRRLTVTLLGEDMVGSFRLVRNYKLLPGETAYTMELAAVVTLGIVEGRWKEVRAPARRSDVTSVSTPQTAPLPWRGETVRLFVEYPDRGAWQSIRRHLAALPEASGMQVGGISARGAEVTLLFPGGGQALATVLARDGYELEPIGNTWVLRVR